MAPKRPIIERLEPLTTQTAILTKEKMQKTVSRKVSTPTMLLRGPNTTTPYLDHTRQ
jgi:hypothetical protein